MEFSPLAAFLALCLHIFILAFGFLPHYTLNAAVHHAKTVDVFFPNPIIRPPQTVNLPDLSVADLTSENLQLSMPLELESDRDHYYLPQELSQQVSVIYDPTARLNLSIGKPVILALYSNQAGKVDEVVIEERGDLTIEDEAAIKEAFGEMVFLAGLRGTKVVKALFRIELQVNRRLIIHY